MVTRSAADGAGLEMLVFRHPLAGMQLVKGTVEAGESPSDAALRELHEEAGVAGVVSAALGHSAEIAEGEVWWFYHCRTGVLPERWVHHTQDGGGLDFAFSWRPITQPATADWHPVFVRALAYAVAVLG